MDFWINLETSAGVQVGSGPLKAVNWQHTPRLDGAGDFSFTVPAGDAKSAGLVNKRVARCYGILDGAVTEIGAGIIESITTSPGDPTTIQVTGTDLMGELAMRTVGNLIVCEQAWTSLDVEAKGGLAYLFKNESGYVDPDIEIPLAHDGNTGTYE